MHREISTKEAPTPVGHYSQAIHDGRYLFVSGQLGMDPQTGTVIDADAGGQTTQALRNIGAILQEAGASPTNVVKSTVFMSDAKDWPEINRAYADYFGAHRPARSAVPTSALPLGALVEIEVIAHVGDGATA